MFRFAKPDGQPYNLNYTGPIFAFDSGNDLIAVCDGGKGWFDVWVEKGILKSTDDKNTYEFNKGRIEEMDDEEFDDMSGDICNPFNWDEWRIVINVSEEQEGILQRAIASAYSAITLCERIVCEK